MKPTEAAVLVGEALASLRIPYFITGSIASMWYGDPRFTRDVDVVVDLSPEQVEPLAQMFIGPDYYCDAESLGRMARTGGMANIIHVPSAMKFDLIRLSSLRFSRQTLERARPAEMVPGHPVMMSSPEDVIINKLLFYDEGGSDKHLRDIASMLRVQGTLIERAYVEKWAEEFGIDQHWREALRKVGPPTDNPASSA